MFEEVQLLGTVKKWIPLSTRLGNPIDNEQGPAITPEMRTREATIVRTYGGDWKSRVQPKGGYNCAGHVWAARRTAIIDASEMEKILHEDSYRTVNEASVSLGDLAVYRDPRRDKIVHVGEVIEILTDPMRLIFILSKWDSCSGEYIHKARDVPFRTLLPDVELEYWTERLRRDL